MVKKRVDRQLIEHTHQFFSFIFHCVYVRSWALSMHRSFKLLEILSLCCSEKYHNNFQSIEAKGSWPTVHDTVWITSVIKNIRKINDRQKKGELFQVACTLFTVDPSSVLRHHLRWDPSAWHISQFYVMCRFTCLSLSCGQRVLADSVSSRLFLFHKYSWLIIFPPFFHIRIFLRSSSERIFIYEKIISGKYYVNRIMIKSARKILKFKSELWEISLTSLFQTNISQFFIISLPLFFQ